MNAAVRRNTAVITSMLAVAGDCCFRLQRAREDEWSTNSVWTAVGLYMDEASTPEASTAASTEANTRVRRCLAYASSQASSQRAREDELGKVVIRWTHPLLQLQLWIPRYQYQDTNTKIPIPRYQYQDTKVRALGGDIIISLLYHYRNHLRAPQPAKVCWSLYTLPNEPLNLMVPLSFF